jgi:hypothetical protein
MLNLADYKIVHAMEEYFVNSQNIKIIMYNPMIGYELLLSC